MLLKKNTAVTVHVPYDKTGGFVPGSIQRFFGGGFDHFNGTFSLDSFGSSMEGVAYCNIVAGDINFVGDLVLFCADGNDLRGWRSFQIVDYDPSGIPAISTADLNAIRDKIFNEVFDPAGSASFRQLLMATAAIWAGEEATVAGVVDFKDWSGTKTRVSIPVMPGGNRGAATFDFS